MRPLELDSASDASLDFVASWLQKCTREHATGRCSQGSTVLPTRVLDIGSQGDIIKLVDVTDQMGKYASLSYCVSEQTKTIEMRFWRLNMIPYTKWGRSPPYLTSQDNIEVRRAGIDIRETPQTFKDAVLIARRLGLRFLWIDSLCICQDDAGDWARESSRMFDVYSNAHIIIAANRSNDCDRGIFHTRAARPSTVFKLPGGKDEVHAMLLFPSDQSMAWPATEFPNEPLTKRAWALQERVLGKRVIHYNDRQIYFECDQGIFAEDGSHQERHCRLNDGLFPSHELQTSPDSLSDYKADLRLWYGLVRAYGRRELSKATDKMPAISGLARLFHRRLGGDYVAGLWSKAIIEGLAWQGLGDGAPASRDQYVGPSWSWTGYAGIGATGLRPGWVDVAEVLDWHVDLKHEANPYGEVKDAWLRIRGPAIQLRHSTMESNEHEVSLGRAGLRPLPRVCTPHSECEEGVVMKTDDEEMITTSEWKSWRIEVLILGGYEKDRRQESQSEEDGAGQAMRSFYGLVVRNAGDEGEKMQRIGWMFLDGEEGSKIQEDAQNWKTVTLV